MAPVRIPRSNDDDIDLKINEVLLVDPARPDTDRYVELQSEAAYQRVEPSSLSGFSLIFMAENRIEVSSIYLYQRDLDN